MDGFHGSGLHTTWDIDNPDPTTGETLMNGYRFDDKWPDGSPRHLGDLSIHYEKSKAYTMIELLGLDLMKMIGLEVAQMLDLPYEHPRPALYGHRGYVFPHWGECGNGGVSYNVVVQEPEGGQKVFEIFLPFAYNGWPNVVGNKPGDFDWEEVRAVVYNDTGSTTKDGYYYELRPHANMIKPIQLIYHRERTWNGTVTPEHGSIEARELKEAAHLCALYFWDKYFGLKKIERKVPTNG